MAQYTRSIKKRQRFVEDFKKFQSKAGCIHTQDQAERIWKRIKDRLTEDERRKIVTAQLHVMSEGRDELDTVCNEIIKNYEG